MSQANAEPSNEPRVYWHRALPPLRAEVAQEHVVEAESQRVPLHYADRDAQWELCYEALKRTAEARIGQELDRTGGWCARIFDEEVHSKADDREGTYWLTGRFSYVQYNRPLQDRAGAGGEK